MANSELLIYTIYDRPDDYPDKFIVRRHVIEAGKSRPESKVFAEADTLAEARASLPEGLQNLGRYHDDEAQIVESWI